MILYHPVPLGVLPAAPPELRRLLRGGAGGVDRPGDDRGEVRAGSTRPTPGTSTSTAPRTPTTASTRSTCGTGGRTRWTTSATWCGSAPTAAPPPGWASGRPRPCTTRSRWCRHGRQRPDDHLPAQPAARAGGRPMSDPLTRAGRSDVRTAAVGLALGAAPARARRRAGAPAPDVAEGVPDGVGAHPGGRAARARHPARRARAARAVADSSVRSPGSTCWTAWAGRWSSSATTARTSTRRCC